MLRPMPKPSPGAHVSFTDGAGFNVLESYEHVKSLLEDSLGQDDRIELTTYQDVPGERLPIRIQTPAGMIFRIQEVTPELEAAQAAQGNGAPSKPAELRSEHS